MQPRRRRYVGATNLVAHRRSRLVRYWRQSANVGELLVAKPSAPTAVSVGGRCLRILRALREHMVYLSVLFCCTLTAMDACYSQFSTSARPSFCRSRCPPTALCRRSVSTRPTRAKTGNTPENPLYLYYSGIFRDFQGHLKGFQGTLGGFSGQWRVIEGAWRAIGCRQERPAFQPLALGPPPLNERIEDRG